MAIAELEISRIFKAFIFVSQVSGFHGGIDTVVCAG